MFLLLVFILSPEARPLLPPNLMNLWCGMCGLWTTTTYEPYSCQGRGMETLVLGLLICCSFLPFFACLACEPLMFLATKRHFPDFIFLLSMIWVFCSDGFCLSDWWQGTSYTSCHNSTSLHRSWRAGVHCTSVPITMPSRIILNLSALFLFFVPGHSTCRHYSCTSCYLSLPASRLYAAGRFGSPLCVPQPPVALSFFSTLLSSFYVFCFQISTPRRFCSAYTSSIRDTPRPAFLVAFLTLSATKAALRCISDNKVTLFTTDRVVYRRP